MTAQVDARPALARINTVLAGWEAQPVADGDWMPGDPLHSRPRGHWNGEQTIRPMAEVLDDFTPTVRCDPCGVDWAGLEPCWVCGTERRPVVWQVTPGLIWQIPDPAPVLEFVDVSPWVARVEEWIREFAVRLEPFQRALLDRWIPDEEWRQATQPHSPAPLLIDGRDYHRRRRNRRRAR